MHSAHARATANREQRDRPALVARGLRKAHGSVPALDGFDLEVAAGTVHALLGPNGAGKSTAVHAFATLTRPDSGKVEVAGIDAMAHPAAVRARIGLVGQHSALDEVLLGRENLVMFGRLQALSKSAARERADDLLATFGLTEAGDRKVSTYSGGMRRRLDIAVGLIRRPEILFLDEPTTGLDPRARSEVWQTIREIVAAGTTVLLTTQYLDEADQLADRVSILSVGKVVAEGTTDELKDRLGGDRIVLRAHHPTEVPTLADAVGGVGDLEALTVTVEAGPEGGTAALLTCVRALDPTGLAVADLQVRRPTLDEVFWHLTDPTINSEGVAE